MENIAYHRFQLISVISLISELTLLYNLGSDISWIMWKDWVRTPIFQPRRMFYTVGSKLQGLSRSNSSSRSELDISSLFFRDKIL